VPYGGRIRQGRKPVAVETTAWVGRIWAAVLAASRSGCDQVWLPITVGRRPGRLVAALRTIAPALLARGYHLVTVPQLLGLRPAHAYRR
jgi:hypothetical protein